MPTLRQIIDGQVLAYGTSEGACKAVQTKGHQGKRCAGGGGGTPPAATRRGKKAQFEGQKPGEPVREFRKRLDMFKKTNPRAYAAFVQRNWERSFGNVKRTGGYTL